MENCYITGVPGSLRINKLPHYSLPIKDSIILCLLTLISHISDILRWFDFNAKLEQYWNKKLYKCVILSSLLWKKVYPSPDMKNIVLVLFFCSMHTWVSAKLFPDSFEQINFEKVMFENSIILVHKQVIWFQMAKKIYLPLWKL